MSSMITLTKISRTLLVSAALSAANTAMADCDLAFHAFVKPLLGEWEEYEQGESGQTLIGVLSTRLVSGGCAIQQSFRSPDGSFSFSSLGFADSTGELTETYVFSDGRVSSYRWSGSGGAVVLNRIASKPEISRRLRILDISADSYLVESEESHDGGQTWQLIDRVKTVRIVNR